MFTSIVLQERDATIYEALCRMFRCEDAGGMLRMVKGVLGEIPSRPKRPRVGHDACEVIRKVRLSSTNEIVHWQS